MDELLDYQSCEISKHCPLLSAWIASAKPSTSAMTQYTPDEQGIGSMRYYFPSVDGRKDKVDGMDFQPHAKVTFGAPG
jgi:hypothetical protein